MTDRSAYPETPDGRYFLVGGRLWRTTNPALPDERRHKLVAELMDARRAVKDAKRGHGELNAARARVESAKVKLGERGPVWWTDGAPDFNRHLVKNTPYADWASGLATKKGLHSVNRSQSHEGEMQDIICHGTEVCAVEPLDVDLPLDVLTLNERLHDIGVWLMERHIPGEGHVRWEPRLRRIRVSFSDADHAGAFRREFGGALS